MHKLMKVSVLTIDQADQLPAVILKDVEEKKVLSIGIGPLEAFFLGIQLGNITLSRPLTHDLLKNILDTAGIEVRRIEINEFKDNTFYATIYLYSHNREYVIDSRPSDAIILALKTDSQIYVSEKVLQKVKTSGLKEFRRKKGSKEKKHNILEVLTPEEFGKYIM